MSKIFVQFADDPYYQTAEEEAIVIERHLIDVKDTLLAAARLALEAFEDAYDPTDIDRDHAAPVGWMVEPMDALRAAIDKAEKS